MTISRLQRQEKCCSTKLNWLDLFFPMERNNGYRARNIDLLFKFFISASKGLSICCIFRRMETSAGEGQLVHVARQILLMTHGRCDWCGRGYQFYIHCLVQCRVTSVCEHGQCLHKMETEPFALTRESCHSNNQKKVFLKKSADNFIWLQFEICFLFAISFVTYPNKKFILFIAAF